MYLFEKYQDLINDYGYSQLFNKWSLVATIAASLERRVWLDEQAIGYMYPNMYVILVGPPATKKTSCAKMPIDLFLSDLEDKGPVFSSDQLTPASLIYELQAANLKKTESLSSPLYIYSPEFGVFFKDIGGGSVIDLLLDFFDNRRLGKKWQKNTMKHGMQEIICPSLTMLGCTTVTALQDAKMSEVAGMGFTGRTLFIYEPNLVCGVPFFPQLDIGKKFDITEEISRICSMKGEFKFSENAKLEYLKEFDAKNSWLLNNPGDGPLNHYMTRRDVQLKKLSMVLSAMRNSDKIIEQHDIRTASKMLTELEANLPILFGLQTIHKDPGMAFKILAKLNIGEVVTMDAIMNRFYKSGQAIPYNSEFKDALIGLVKSGALEQIMIAGEPSYRKIV